MHSFSDHWLVGCKKFNANIGVTLVLTGFLINPAFSDIFEASKNVTLFGLPVTNVYYGSSVLRRYLVFIY